ncbi:hypothetical protein FB451DRAFT_1415523 [Mycena latifolia]|nr:hypothetical protein FB451DRAFT_1415523 [Mycena latifolia]
MRSPSIATSALPLHIILRSHLRDTKPTLRACAVPRVRAVRTFQRGGLRALHLRQPWSTLTRRGCASATVRVAQMACSGAFCAANGPEAHPGANDGALRLPLRDASRPLINAPGGAAKLADTDCILLLLNAEPARDLASHRWLARLFRAQCGICADTACILASASLSPRRWRTACPEWGLPPRVMSLSPCRASSVQSVQGTSMVRARRLRARGHRVSSDSRQANGARRPVVAGLACSSVLGGDACSAGPREAMRERDERRPALLDRPCVCGILVEDRNYFFLVPPDFGQIRKWVFVPDAFGKQAAVSSQLASSSTLG